MSFSATATATLLHHLAAAWFAVSLPYLVGWDSLPEPWVAAVLSTCVALVLGTVDAMRRIAPDEEGAAPAPSIHATPDPDAPAPAVWALDLHRYETSADPFATHQCPRCGGFDLDGERTSSTPQRCRTCDQTSAPGGQDLVVVVRSWLHHETGGP